MLPPPNIYPSDVAGVESSVDPASKEIDVFSGAGDVGDKTDGVVTVESAYGLQEFTEHIHLQTFHEAHSDLHESSEVDKAVYQFLKRD